MLLGFAGKDALNEDQFDQVHFLNGHFVEVLELGLPAVIGVLLFDDDVPRCGIVSRARYVNVIRVLNF